MRQKVCKFEDKTEKEKGTFDENEKTIKERCRKETRLEIDQVWHAGCSDCF